MYKSLYLQQTLGALAMGIDSFIGISHNVFAKVFNDILTSFDKKDLAGARQQQVRLFIEN